MSNAVFVLDTHLQPCKPVHPAVARRMLTSGQSAVLRRYPLTIICQPGVSTGISSGWRCKLDPGSKSTGIALLDGERVLWVAELTHRGQRIRARLDTRRAARRSRRSRKTRYRAPRFLNRRRPAGWLPPSLRHRVETTMTWIRRLGRVCPITALSIELARFDTQRMQHPDITGIEYQQGTLTGYELREYLLEKWQRTCAYCGATGVPLEIEHLVPRSRGGSNRVSNLTLACAPCNQRKGQKTAAEFGSPALAAQAKQPLHDAAAVNSTRLVLWRALEATGLPVETGTGRRTKYHRTRLGLPKTHWLDAVCVGASTPEVLRIRTRQPLDIISTGRGSRQMCRTDKQGFPIRHLARRKRHFGFQTGDIVCAEVPKGRHTGRHLGRIAVRPRGSFNLQGKDIHYKYMRLIQRADGYAYAVGASLELPPTATFSPVQPNAVRSG